MTLSTLLLAIAQVSSVAPSVLRPVAPPSADWSRLPPIPYRAPPPVTPQMTAYVAREVAAGRCLQPRSTDGHHHVALDVAVLLAPDDTVRKAMPRAINCPNVEQYGAGLVTVMLRDNLQQRHAVVLQWYHTTLTFDW